MAKKPSKASGIPMGDGENAGNLNKMMQLRAQMAKAKAAAGRDIPLPSSDALMGAYQGFLKKK